LGVGDRAGSELRVTDPSLVDTAISLGLDQNTGSQQWLGYCGEIGSDGSPCVIQVTKANEQNMVTTEHSVRVTMNGNGEDWLISAVEPCTYWYDNTGGHCD
jgi:hypothetical protein